MFHVVASQNVSFRHLCLHGNPERTQSQCIRLDSAGDVTVQNVEFRAASDAGIYIQGGGPGAAPGRRKIVDNLFVDCGSGITLDGTTTDGTTTPIEEVVIQGNIIRQELRSRAELVSLTHAHRVQFVSNTIWGGGVLCTNIQDFVISNNIIVGVSGQEGQGLLLVGALRGAVTGNSIYADHTIPPETAETSIYKGISLEQSSEQIRLSQNTIGARERGINILDCKDISVSDNVLERILGATDGTIGINVERTKNTIEVPLVDAIQVRNNHIHDFQYGIQAAGNSGDLTRLVVVGNQTRGLAGTAIHIQSGVPAATVHGNQAAPGETALSLPTSEYIVTAAGFAGNGSPQGIVTAEVGSLYTELKDSPSLWIKERPGVDGWERWERRNT
jgi:hypothetical protein